MNLKPLKFLRGMAGRAALAAVTAGFALVGSAAAQQVKLERPDKDALEVVGPGWKIHYGTGFDWKAFVLQPNSEQTYFSHAGWLRQIDVKKGVVTGRWRFPGEITTIAAEGDKLQVTLDINIGVKRFYPKLTFDPKSPVVPLWPNENLLLNRVPLREAGDGEAQKLKPEQASALLEESVRRDPLSPWFRLNLAAAMKRAGNPRATENFFAAVRLPGLWHLEQLQLNQVLIKNQEYAAARETLETGYRKYWQEGNDPRQFTWIIGRLIMFIVPPRTPSGNFVEELRPEYIEFIYRLTPYGEAAELAWYFRAQELESQGQAEQAAVWRRRAEEAERKTLNYIPFTMGKRVDDLLILTVASLLTIPLFILALYGRYRPQRKFDVAARRATPGAKRGFALFNVQYWSRSERVGFLFLVLIAWVSTGWMGCLLGGLLRAAAMPISMTVGTLSGPAATWWIENRMPATAQRDLLLAMAHHQSGETEKAEQLYRNLPQFAESWNNLGAILKEAGKPQDAKQAFERALELNPDLTEAAFNLGRPVNNEWVALHQKYRPGKPMLAPPVRAQWVAAFMGGTYPQIAWRALAGPFSAHVGLFGSLFSLAGDSSDSSPGLIGNLALALLIGGLLLAVASLVFIPVRDVTQPPGRWQTPVQVLIPGSSPAWSWMGALAMGGWCFAGMAGFLLWRIGTSRILLGIGIPNLARSYGVVQPADFFQFISPSWAYVLVPLAMLYAVNIGLVLWQKRRGG